MAGGLRRGIAFGVACVLVVSGCGRDGASIQRDGGGGGDVLRVENEGVTITAPAGSVSSGAQIDIDPGDRSLPSEDLTNLLGPVMRSADITFTSGELEADRTVEISFAVPASDVESRTEAGEVAVLYSVGADGRTDLYPASYDEANGTMTAEVGHFSEFWLAWLDPKKLFEPITKTITDAIGLTYPQPSCVGQPVDVGGRSLRIDAVDPGVAWPCLTASGNGGASITLHSNSPLVWRVRTEPSAPGSSAAGLSLSGIFTEELYRVLFAEYRDREAIVQPGGQVTFDFEPGGLPQRGEMVAEAGLLLVSAFVFGLSVAAKPFGVDLMDKVLRADGAVGCLTDAVDAGLDLGDAERLQQAIAGLLKATGKCISTLTETVIQTVVGIVIGGVTLLAGMLVGLLNEVLGRNHATFTVTEQAAGVPLYTLLDSTSAVGTNGQQIDATLAGQRFEDSTGMWVGCEGSAATATFQLDGRYGRLTATAGLQSHTPSELTAHVTITGDGAVLSEFTTGPGNTVPVEVSVAGVREVTVAAIRESGTCTVSGRPYGALGNAQAVP